MSGDGTRIHGFCVENMDRLARERDEALAEVTALTAENARLRPLVERMAKLGAEPCGDIVNWYAEWADISIACRPARKAV